MPNRKRTPTAERDAYGRPRAARRRARLHAACAWCAGSLDGKRADAKCCSDYCSDRAYYTANREFVLSQKNAYGKKKTQERRAVRASLPSRQCSHDDCFDDASPQSPWCSLHRQRVTRTGDPGPGARLRAPAVHPTAPPPEAVHDTERCAWWETSCQHKVYSQDLCKVHYGRAHEIDGAAPKFARYTADKVRTDHMVVVSGPGAAQGTCSLCGPGVRVKWVATNRPGGCVTRPACYRTANSSQRRRATGWSEEDYDLAVIAQGNRCAICVNSPVGRGMHSVLHADHCHAEQRARGLLCGKCNHMLGMAGDDAEVLVAAANYLAQQAGRPRLF